jgi:hypothetical protein
MERTLFAGAAGGMPLPTGEEELLPQPVTNPKIRIRKEILLNFIDAHSLRD